MYRSSVLVVSESSATRTRSRRGSAAGSRVTNDDVWVADVDGVVVAYLIVAHASTPAFLDHLYIDPSWMGRGLGDRLMSLASERAGAGLQLWTHQVNAGARRFYERHGFTVAETTDGATNEERLPDVRYVRRETAFVRGEAPDARPRTHAGPYRE